MLKQFMKISLFFFVVLCVSGHVWGQDTNPYEADTLKAIKFIEAKDFDSAKQIIEKLLAATETPEGNNANMAISLSTLGNKCRLNSKYEIGIVLLKKAIEIGINTHGKEHLQTQTSINRLAFLYDDQGEYSEAETLYKQCLQLREKTLGKEDPRTLTSMNNLGLCCS